MPPVLVAGAVIECVHGGRYRLPGPGAPALTVSGHGALVMGAEAGRSFAPGSPGLLTPCSFSTAAGPQPCVTAPALPAGLSRKLTVGGRPVLLATANGTSTSNPGTWLVGDPGQQLLEAI
ncbi:hypothetical protein ACFVHB_28565 [Kitasatospora sp. NPDC127111]|uniref:hypothetical protein n=1 Tax=Kitasatospora sp. NPDC127111 TaxID=3345363 RepID=UPI00362E8BA2